MQEYLDLLPRLQKMIFEYRYSAERNPCPIPYTVVAPLLKTIPGLHYDFKKQLLYADKAINRIDHQRLLHACIGDYTNTKNIDYSVLTNTQFDHTRAINKFVHMTQSDFGIYKNIVEALQAFFKIKYVTAWVMHHPDHLTLMWITANPALIHFAEDHFRLPSLIGMPMPLFQAYIDKKRLIETLLLSPEKIQELCTPITRNWDIEYPLLNTDYAQARDYLQQELAKTFAPKLVEQVLKHIHEQNGYWEIFAGDGEPQELDSSTAVMHRFIDFVNPQEEHGYKIRQIEASTAPMRSLFGFNYALHMPLMYNDRILGVIDFVDSKKINATMKWHLRALCKSLSLTIQDATLREIHRLSSEPAVFVEVDYTKQPQFSVIDSNEAYQRIFVTENNTSLFEKAMESTQSAVWQAIHNTVNRGYQHECLLTIPGENSEKVYTVRTAYSNASRCFVYIEDITDEVFASNHDVLTGLYNEHKTMEYLYKELAAAQRNQEQLAIMYFDLNLLKRINDDISHATGDEYLKTFAQLLQTQVRTTDFVGRLKDQGDEFIVICPGIETPAIIEKIITQIIQASKEKQWQTAQGLTYTMSFSVGVALRIPRQKITDIESYADTLIQHAEQAMYLAKQQSHAESRFAFYQEQP